jgi:hypothetical protein
VGPEQRPQLREVREVRHRCVVVCETGELVQARLPVTEEPVLLEQLADDPLDVGLGHDHAPIGGAGGVGALDELVRRSSSGAGHL